MRKFVATAAIAATAAATLLAFPAASQANVEPSPFANLILCANTTPGSSGGIPGGSPVFFRVDPQNGAVVGPNRTQPGNNVFYSTVDVGVQDGQCEGVNIPEGGRVKVQRLATSASSTYCGAIAEMQCQGPQTPYNEMSWSDSFSSGRQRTNEIEIILPGVTVGGGSGTAFVSDWTHSAL
jgi:hypothetical protein